MIDKCIDRAARALELALALGFLFAILLNFANVVGRYVFGRSLLWADEIQIFIMIAMTFLGAVVVTWRRAHLRMDALSRIMPARAQSLLRALELGAMLVLCGFVFSLAQDYTSRMFSFGKTSDTAGLPMWIPHGSIALGFGLIFLVCCWHVFRAVKPASTPTPSKGAR